MQPQDLIRAGKIGRAALEKVTNQDWRRPAAGLEWSCRSTVNHMLDSLLMFAARAAILERRHTEGARAGDDHNSVQHLAYLLEPCSAVLAQVASLMPPAGRAFHPSGMADAAGFIAMGTLEVLIHTRDVVEGLESEFDPPPDLCSSTVARLFPWVEVDGRPWDVLLWAAGRIALPDRPQQADDWWVHAAPLAEWDGTVRTRPRPEREGGGSDL